MPTSAPKPCSSPGCKRLVRDGSGRCEQHQREKRAEFDSRRGSSTERGYNSRWQKYREAFLKRNQLCVMHQKLGQVVPATVVDHIIPHRGDHKLFWDKANHQALCESCHNRHKQRQEYTGKESGCDTSGIPFDANHHWKTGEGG